MIAAYFVENNEPRVRVVQQCCVCGEDAVLDVDPNGFILWAKGVKVQDAFPKLSADDRELLISGTHKECFDKLFPMKEKEEND